MDIDVAGVLHRLRQLEREHGARSTAPSAPPPTSPRATCEKRPRIDNMRFGAAMVAKGYVPKDKVGAAELGMKLAKQMLPGGKKRPAGAALPAGAVDAAVLRRLRDPAGPRAARASCTRWPPGSASASTRRRTPAAAATRAAAPSPACSQTDAARLHGVPGLRRQPRGERRARPCRSGTRSPSVPAAARGIAHAGGRRRASSRTSAASPTATRPWPRSATPPSRPAPRWSSTTRPCTTAAAAPSAACTAAPPRASARLLEFAAAAAARPSSRRCVLCRDNLRSAARELKLDVPVHFWPEFFRAVATPEEPPMTDPEERTDD